jgi:hypothetical protein
MKGKSRTGIAPFGQQTNRPTSMSNFEQGMSNVEGQGTTGQASVPLTLEIGHSLLSI